MANKKALPISAKYAAENPVTLATMDCIRFLEQIPSNEAQLVVTSPPYNIGKEYEDRLTTAEYKTFLKKVVAECVRIVRPGGSICWEVGTYMEAPNRPRPLAFMLHPMFEEYEESSDLFLRNAIIWHFGHGLHTQRRFSGRYETILWYTKGDGYTFNLDDVRIPQKYPGKRYHKGKRKGKLSGNPRGKNPSDLWLDIPNVKSNHVEKSIHPCQFPVGLVKRLILALSNPGDLVVDPFMGVGSTAVAAVLAGRRAAGCDLDSEYIEVARDRARKAARGKLAVRENRPVYEPEPDTPLTRVPRGFWEGSNSEYVAAALSDRGGLAKDKLLT